MPVIFANNASSRLTAGINTSATQLVVEAGDAGEFPTPSGGQWFPLTVVDASGNMEIMRVTGRAGAVLTVVRAQEGTSAKAFGAGSGCDLRLTAAIFNDLNARYLAGYDQSVSEAPNTLVRRTSEGAVVATQLHTTTSGSGLNIRLGDDVWLGDFNVANGFRIQGQQNADAGYVMFGGVSALLGANTGIASGALTWGGNIVWHTGNDGPTSGMWAENAEKLQGQFGAYFLAFSNFTGQATDSQLPYDMGAKRFPGGIAIGAGVIPSGALTNGKAIAIGDGDTGWRQNGDGLLEMWCNNQRVLGVMAGGWFDIQNSAGLYVNGVPAAMVSQSTNKTEVNFPIGTVLVAMTAAPNIDRQGMKVLCHSGYNDSDFYTSDREGAGTALAGTWRCCGRIADYVHAFQRI